MQLFALMLVSIWKSYANACKTGGEELRRFGRAAQFMCSPGANFGKPPRACFVVQFEEAKTEWRRACKLRPLTSRRRPSPCNPSSSHGASDRRPRSSMSHHRDVIRLHTQLHTHCRDCLTRGCAWVADSSVLFRALPT